MAFTPQGLGQWNVMEWDHTMFALTPGNYANVFMGSSVPAPGMTLAYIEIDLTAPVGGFPWGADMADPWTAEIGFYLIHPPDYPSAYQDACADNPRTHFGFAFQADGYAHCVSVGKQTLAWMGGTDWIRTVDVMSGHLDGIGTGSIGSSFYTLQLANSGAYNNSYINMQSKDGVRKYQAHAIRASGSFASLFPTPGGDTNLVLWACVPTGSGSAFNLDHIYVGNGCFPDWRSPIAQVPENIGARLHPDRNVVCMRDGSASYDLYGAKLKYDWEMMNAPDGSAVATVVTDGHTDVVVPPYTDTLKKTGIGALVAVGDWVVYANTCYIITGSAADSITINSEVFPTGTTGIYVKIISQNAAGWVTSDEAITAVPIDVAGSYITRLRVHNGVRYGHPAETAIMARSPHTKTGIEVNADWIWSYLSDVWGYVEEKEFATEYFSALMQQASSLLMQTWQAEADGDLLTAQPFLDYRWMMVNRVIEEEGDTSFVSGLACVAGQWGGAIAGQTLDLRLYTGSEGYVDVTLTLTCATALAEASDINTALEQYLLQASTMDYAGITWIFIKGPIGIEIRGGSLVGMGAQFTLGDSTLFEGGGFGAGGEVIGPSKYRLEKPAYGLELNRHFLVIRGEAYEISRIEHGPAMPFTDVSIIGEFPDMDEGDLSAWAIPGYLKSDTDYHGQLAFSGDDLTLLRVDTSDTVTTEVVPLVGCMEHGIGTMSSTPYNPYYAAVAPLKVKRTFYHPIDDKVFSIPLVQAKMVPTIPEDYFYEGDKYAIDTYRDGKCLNYIYYNKPSYAMSAYTQAPIHADITERAFAEQVIVDNTEVIYRNFGYLVGLEYDSSVTPDVLHYLDAVRGLWKLYAEGRTPEGLRRGINMFFALSVCQRNGVVKQVMFYGNSDYGHMLVEDADNPAVTRTYVLDRKADLADNPRTNLPWAIGDEIHRFERISGGADVQDMIINPNYYASYVGLGGFPEEMNRLTAYHRFLIRASGYSVNAARYTEFMEFVNKWRPQYTQLIFALLATPRSDINILDSVKMTVTLHLKDGFCSFWSGVSDDCDLGGHFLTADNLGLDPNPPHYPISSIQSDMGKYCPKNIIKAYLRYTFADEPKMYDTIFFWDEWYSGGVDYQYDVKYTGSPLSKEIILEPL